MNEVPKLVQQGFLLGFFHPVLGRASQIVIYRWNKEYPADRFFDVNLSAEGFRFYRKTDFPGTSHNDIDREVYVR